MFDRQHNVYEAFSAILISCVKNSLALYGARVRSTHQAASYHGFFFFCCHCSVSKQRLRPDKVQNEVLSNLLWTAGNPSGIMALCEVLRTPNIGNSNLTNNGGWRIRRGKYGVSEYISSSTGPAAFFATS